MVLFRAGPTRVRRGTQGHVAEPRGPAQRLRGAYYIPIVYLYYILYISRGFQPSVARKGIHPLGSSGIMNPRVIINFFRVGLSPTQCFQLQATWSEERRWIAIGARRSSGRAVHGSRSRPRALLKQVITVLISCDVAASHTSDQGAESDASIT